ncbi:MAG TPA: PHP domain-containing protein [Dehalococcoidales bacterium]
MSQVDLHIHTTASDGKFSPAEIVRKAHANGLIYIGICDHDSIAGIVPAQEASRNFPGLTVISGVEINTDIPAGELHILGYYCDCDNTELNTTLERLRSSRIGRAKKMVAKLRSMGIKIDYERVEEIAGAGSVGRPHVAEALLEKGYINNFREAFAKYIGRGGPAYVERDKITPAEAVQLIRRADGIPVLAHPLTSDNYEALVAGLKPAGLLGLEVYYGNYGPEQIQALLTLAAQFDLIATGGSDFHGLDSANEPQLGQVDVPLTCAERLMAMVRK